MKWIVSRAFGQPQESLSTTVERASGIEGTLIWAPRCDQFSKLTPRHTFCEFRSLFYHLSCVAPGKLHVLSVPRQLCLFVPESPTNATHESSAACPPPSIHILPRLTALFPVWISQEAQGLLGTTGWGHSGTVDGPRSGRGDLNAHRNDCAQQTGREESVVLGFAE